MPAQLTCPKHGYFDASYGTCPTCSGKLKPRPSAPARLDEDDLETDVERSYAKRSSRYTDDDGETTTDIVKNRGDEDDGDTTEVVSGRRKNLDKTELYDNKKTRECEAILWVKEGERRGKIYKLREETEIGREDFESSHNADKIELDDEKASRQHAKIALRDGQYIIVDTLSSNGTFINGKKISAETVLKENDLIKIGDTTFILKIL